MAIFSGAAINIGTVRRVSTSTGLIARSHQLPSSSNVGLVAYPPIQHTTTEPPLLFQSVHRPRTPWQARTTLRNNPTRFRASLVTTAAHKLGPGRQAGVVPWVKWARGPEWRSADLEEAAVDLPPLQAEVSSAEPVPLSEGQAKRPVSFQAAPVGSSCRKCRGGYPITPQWRRGGSASTTEPSQSKAEPRMEWVGLGRRYRATVN